MSFLINKKDDDYFSKDPNNRLVSKNSSNNFEKSNMSNRTSNAASPAVVTETSIIEAETPGVKNLRVPKHGKGSAAKVSNFSDTKDKVTAINSKTAPETFKEQAKEVVAEVDATARASTTL